MGGSGNKETIAAPHMGDCALIRCHIAQDPIIDMYTFDIAALEDGTLRGLKRAESEFYRSYFTYNKNVPFRRLYQCIHNFFFFFFFYKILDCLLTIFGII
jgi:hypothetical protein